MRRRRNALAIVLLIWTHGPVAAELFVTHARPRPDLEGEEGQAQAADLEFGGALLVRGVELRTEPRLALKLPGSGSAHFGLPDVRVPSSALRSKIAEVFRTRTFVTDYFPPEEIYFSVGPPRRPGSGGRADLEITFSGELVVVLGAVLSGGGWQVLYPERPRPGGGRERLFEVLDLGLRRRVEDAVAARLRSAYR